MDLKVSGITPLGAILRGKGW